MLRRKKLDAARLNAPATGDPIIRPVFDVQIKIQSSESAYLNVYLALNLKFF